MISRLIGSMAGIAAILTAGAVLAPQPAAAQAQFALTLGLYVGSSVARKRAVERGETDYAAFVLGYDERLHVARITSNLANQYELPVLFYALVLLLVTTGDVTDRRSCRRRCSTARRARPASRCRRTRRSGMHALRRARARW